MSKHGGRRQGAGRRKGSLNVVTTEIRSAAQKHGKKALDRLVYLIDNAESEATQVAACREILDRAYGKSMQPSENATTHNVSDSLAELLNELDQPVFPKSSGTADRQKNSTRRMH